VFLPNQGVHQLGNFMGTSSSFFANRSFGTACSEHGFKPRYGLTPIEKCCLETHVSPLPKDWDLCPNLLDPKTRRGVISNNV